MCFALAFAKFDNERHGTCNFSHLSGVSFILLCVALVDYGKSLNYTGPPTLKFLRFVTQFFLLDGRLRDKLVVLENGEYM